MKSIVKFRLVLVALLLATFVNAFAQLSSDVETAMSQIVAKYDGQKGISCMTVAKGSGLEMMKIMFNREFGKEFMKGVTSITLIDYSDASEETCMTLRKDLDAFLPLLQEFDLRKEKQFSDNDYIRCFASQAESGTLSDFVIALENEKSKMVMYMAGNINVK